MNQSEMISKIRNQLAKDYNCAEKDFDSYKLIVTEQQNQTDRAMKAVCFGGSAIFSVQPKMIPDFKRIFEGKDPDWIFETKTLIMLSEILYLHGHNVDNVYEYHVPDLSAPKYEYKYDIELIENGFDRLKNEELAKEVFGLEGCGKAVLAAASKKNGKIIALAAAFDQSPEMWQITIAVAPEEKFGCAAENILAFIKEATLERGKIPYYGGPFARNISPSTGSSAGFFPCWTQIHSRPRDDEFLNLHGTR